MNFGIFLNLLKKNYHKKDSKIQTLENSEIKNKNIYLGNWGYN